MYSKSFVNFCLKTSTMAIGLIFFFVPVLFVSEGYADRSVRTVETYHKKKKKQTTTLEPSPHKNRVTAKPKSRHGVKIMPKVESPKGLSYFTLKRGVKNGTLTLSFHTKKKVYYLDTDKDFLIHIQAIGAQVDPFIILKKNWARGAKAITLKVKDFDKKSEIRGDAVYRLCKGKSCTKTRSKFSLAD